jgi:mannose-1-phosphate guanylyltransferase
MAQFREFEPEMYGVLIELAEASKEPDFRESVRSIYPRLKKTAIDYAVLEPAAREGRMAVVPTAMQWSDIGSWATLTDAFPADEAGNLFMGPVLADDTANCTIVTRSPQRKVIATIGLRDLAIVDTKDALLVCPKDQCAKVKRLVDMMTTSEKWQGLV